jgi:hypothetical protein
MFGGAVLVRFACLILLLNPFVNASRPFIKGLSPKGLFLKNADFANLLAAQSTLKFDSQTFTCGDGSKAIPLAQVNDNFCDCADGSDEPGRL